MCRNIFWIRTWVRAQRVCCLLSHGGYYITTCIKLRWMYLCASSKLHFLTSLSFVNIRFLKILKLSKKKFIFRILGSHLYLKKICPTYRFFILFCTFIPQIFFTVRMLTCLKTWKKMIKKICKKKGKDKSEKLWKEI